MTSIMYIMGIFAFFTNLPLVLCFIVSVLGIIGICKNFISFKLVLLWIFIFYFGFINSSLRIKTTDELLQIAPKNCEITGQIVSIPNSNFSDKTKFFFKTDKGKTFVTVTDKNNDFSNLKIGNYYKIKGKLRIPFEAVNPSQFDYGNYLKNFGAFTVFYADNSEVLILDKKLTFKWKFLQELNNIRYRILDTHKKYLKSPNIEILGGIVFGDDAVAPPDYIKNIFINSGLLHILAASGMNVAFIYGFWFFLLNKIFRLPFKFTVITGMGMIILYSMMTGLGASVVRATIMILFVLAGKLIDRDTHSVALLSLVAMLMLIYNPAYINDVGFQLSFIVTFGLLVSADLLRYNGNKFVGYLKDCFVIPLIAQLWVAPLQMFYFNIFSLYSIFANTVTAIFLPFISFGGFVSSILSIIPKFSDIICKSFDFILKPFLDLLVNCSTYFANLPHSHITTTHPDILQILLYYIIILLIILLLKNFSKSVLYSTIILTLILLISTIPIKNNNLEIIAFSVQNADSFLIKTPQNKYFIIDTAKSGYNSGKSQAEIIILKYLKDKGIKNLEGMILTHFDNDHAGGAVDLYNNLKIKNIYVNSKKANSLTSRQIIETIKPLTLSKNNDTIYSEPDLEIRNFISGIKNDDNENSIITSLKYKDFTMLFMGDAGITAFNKLKNNLPKNITVLKLGHHGAKNVIDKNMLDTLNPKYVLISSTHNDSNHPHILTLNTLRKSNVLRTDIHNSIKLIVNSKELKIFYFDKNLRRYIKM